MNLERWLTAMVPTLVFILEKLSLTLVILVLIFNDLFRYTSTAMDNTAKAVLTTLRDVRQVVDEQVRKLLILKSEIKQKVIPEKSIPLIFESLLLSVSSNHPPLSLAGFSTFGHFLKRLSLQGMTWMISPFVEAFASAVIARLNDPNERVRAGASETLYNLQHSDDTASVTAVQDCLNLALTGDAMTRVAALNQIFCVSFLGPRSDPALTVRYRRAKPWTLSSTRLFRLLSRISSSKNPTPTSPPTRVSFVNTLTSHSSDCSSKSSQLLLCRSEG